MLRAAIWLWSEEETEEVALVSVLSCSSSRPRTLLRLDSSYISLFVIVIVSPPTCEVTSL